MELLEQLILLNSFLSLGLSMVYFYLYILYREKYMGIWSLSWFLFSVRIGLDLLRFLGYSAIGLLFLNQVTTILSVVLLLWGMHNFSVKKVPRWWLYSAILATLASDLGVIFALPFVMIALPTAAYFGVVQIWTGIMFLRFWGVRGLGKQITGYALMLTGVLNLFYPLMSTGANRSITTIFFAIALIVWLIILLGILLVYFEKVRNELSLSETRFRLLAENAKDVIYRFKLRPARIFEYISPSVNIVTGYSPEEFYQSPHLIFEILDKSYHNRIQNFPQQPEIYKKPSELLIYTKNGEEVWVEQHSLPLYDSDGNLVAVEGIVRDIRERKKVEMELARLDQLRLLGETAAGIAHEIRNPMTTVRGFLQMLMQKTELNKYNELMKLMLTELDRANSIITDFLSLSKAQPSLLRVNNLNQIILGLQPLLENNAWVASKQIRFQLDKIPDFELDEKELKQMVLNLVQNGLESMQPGGILEVRTLAQADQVILSIKDQGSGIVPEVIEKLGTPFFTTKETGTGLGLAVCYSIASRHQAHISVETGPNGTTFSVNFMVTS